MNDTLHILVIAYGNPLRRDDGAGLVLAERLARQWRAQGIVVQQITTHQLVPELAAEIAESCATAVVFVDTTPAAPESSHCIQVRSLDDQDANLTLGHHVDPALIRHMAQGLYGVEIPAWLVTIPGIDFGHGEGFSDEVKAMLTETTAVAFKLIEQARASLASAE